MTTARDTVRAGKGGAIWPLALALTLRVIAWFAVSPSRFASDEDSYFVAAGALLHGEQDLFWPPVTGWLIAAARWILRSDSVATIRLVWIGLDLGCLLAIATLARRLGAAVFTDDPQQITRLTTLATAGYALYLPAISHAQFTTSETPALFQTLLVLVLLTRPRAGVGTSAAAGLLAGTLSLTRPSLMPLLLVWPVAARRIANPSVWRRSALVFFMAGTLVVGAWVVRNRQVTGQPIVSNNSAYNLYLGNRDVYAEDLDLFSPLATREQIEFRRQQWSGQLAYPAGSPAELQRLALAWIAAHPGTFARRAVGRLARVFAPKTDVLELAGGEQRAGIFSPTALVLLSAANAQWTVILFGGLLGLAGILRRAPAIGLLLAGTIAGSLVLCLVAIAKPRYSFVFDPILLLGLATLLAAPRETTAAINPPAYRVLGVIYVFLGWGWVAWLLFALSSRMAL
ncbi:MAG: hypothetical protein ACRD2N_02850 [Vicinamibacterales bacterium]